MVAVKIIDAATWAALPDAEVAQAEDLYDRLGADSYRLVRADLARVTVPALTAGTIDQAVPTIGDRLTVGGSNATAGASCQWQQSADGATGWTDISGATNASLDTSSGVTGGHHVRRGVRDGAQGPVYTASVQVAPAATVPAQIDAPALTVLSASEITAELAADPQDGGMPVTGYSLRYSTDGVTWTVEADISNPHALTGLAADTLHHVQTRAVNAVGAGDWSASATATTQKTDSTDETTNIAGTGTATFTGTMPASNAAGTGTATWSEAA